MITAKEAWEIATKVNDARVQECLNSMYRAIAKAAEQGLFSVTSGFNKSRTKADKKRVAEKLISDGFIVSLFTDEISISW